MFTAEIFQRIRSRCLPEFESLLNRLDIRVDWSGDDEYRIYNRLYTDLTEKLCDKMKSRTIVEGYMSLLDLGGVTYEYGKYDELLDKVVANKVKILDAVRNGSENNSLQELTIEADIAKLFDNVKQFSIVEDIWNSLSRLIPKDKKGHSYHVACRDVETFKSKTEKLNPLLELDGNSITLREEDVAQWLKRKGECLRDGETQILCLKITRHASYRKEPPFTVDEAEDTLDILAQLNEIISLAR